MRVQLSILLVIITILASASARSPVPNPPRPPAPGTFVCNSTTASALGTTITNTINTALQPKANNANTTSSSKSLWSFPITAGTCFGDYFGYNLIPKTCVPDDVTAGMSTVKSTTVTGAYDIDVAVTLSQTSCSTSTKTSTGTFKAQATWPQMTIDSSVGVKFDLLGQTLDFVVEAELSNLSINIAGNYGYNVTNAGTTICVTNLAATAVTVSVGDVSVKYGATSPTTTATNAQNKIESKLNSATTASSIETKINAAFAKVQGKCKTIGTPNPPRPPRSPKVG